MDVERISESANRRISESADTNTEYARTHHASRITPKLLFLTSPNNPDGSLLAPDDLRRLLDLPLIVVLDEAYIEFAGLERSVAGWVLERENLIVLRTFSKWAGIAGLRLGYGIFPGWLMPALWKAKQPYNVNVAATVAGLASLAHRAEIQTTVDALIVERERLLRELATVPVPAPLSQPGELRPLPGGRPGCEGAERGAGRPGDSGAALRQAGAGELHPRQRGPAGADGCAVGGANGAGGCVEQDLVDQAEYWGKKVTDERYAMIADRRRE